MTGVRGPSAVARSDQKSAEIYESQRHCIPELQSSDEAYISIPVFFFILLFDSPIGFRYVPFPIILAHPNKSNLIKDQGFIPNKSNLAIAFLTVGTEMLTNI